MKYISFLTEKIVGSLYEEDFEDKDHPRGKAGKFVNKGGATQWTSDKTTWKNRKSRDEHALDYLHLRNRKNTSVDDYNSDREGRGDEPLTHAEYMMARSYIGDYYQDFNQPLRAGGFERTKRGWENIPDVSSRFYTAGPEPGTRTTDKFSAAVATLNSALDKLPEYKGMAGRYVDLNDEELKDMLDNYKPGEIVTDLGFMSATKNGFANNEKNLWVGTPNVRLIMHSNGGAKDIGDLADSLHKHHPESLPNFDEVIFKSGTSFRVMSVKKTKKSYDIEIEEV